MLFGEVSGEFLTDDSLTLDTPLVGRDGSLSALVSPLQNPVDLTLGLQWNIRSGFFIGAGVNAAAIHDDRQLVGRVSKTGDRLGFLVRIGYHPRVRVYAPPPPPPTPPPENRPPRVTLACDPCEILVGEQSQLHADASDPDGNALEYRWSALAREFQGEASRATRTWQAPDEAGRVPVTVTVDDGQGGTESDTVTIDVSAPPPPPAREYVFENVHFSTLTAIRYAPAPLAFLMKSWRPSRTTPTCLSRLKVTPATSARPSTTWLSENGVRTPLRSILQAEVLAPDDCKRSATAKSARSTTILEKRPVL